MVQELCANDFTDAYAPIFEHISRECGTAFKRESFFSQWRTWMRLGVAKTWSNTETRDSILGVIVAPDVFNDEKRMLVTFWFSLPEARGTGRPSALLRAAEAEARRLGCVLLSSAYHHGASPSRLQQFYMARDYRPTEIIYTKRL